MAVAAYASLLSLMQVLDNVQHPFRRRQLRFDTDRVQSLQEKLQFLVGFLEHHSQRLSQEMEDLARQIVVAANEAEDFIDTHVVDQLREGSEDESYHLAVFSSFCQDIDKVIEKIGSITKELVIIKEEWGNVQEQMPVVSNLPTSSTTLPSSGKDTMIGFDKHLLRVMDELTRDESNLQILPLVGMGGTAWDALKLFFPNNRNGSRVMITTRLANVADSLGSQKPYLMDFLDEDKSWNLFCQKAFKQEGCPYPELEEIGMDITKTCRGLPLAIVVIGGLLANSNMEQEYWKYVAKNVSSFANSEDNEHCLKILALSYNILPIHLKPCFLYMRIFREDDAIEVSKLTKLWIGEGFLKPKRGKSLEEVAKEYLKSLVDRNLVLIHEWTVRGKPKVCGIHDLLRDLCLKEADKEHFIGTPKVQRIYARKGNENLCFLCGDRVSLQETIVVPEIIIGSQLTSGANGLVCEGCKSIDPHLVRLRWVNVFSVPNREYLQHTKLRYIEMKSYTPQNNTMEDVKSISPSTIPLLWDLQTLFFSVSRTLLPIIVPPKIWEMPQLRHIMVRCALLPNPIDTQDSPILENLQTLSLILGFKCTKEIVYKIPNLKKLKICYPKKVEDWSSYCLYNLVHLHKLESLHVRAEELLLKNITFPTSLKKLDLWECKVPWEDMTIIGSLPNLEVVILMYCAFEGSEWNPIEGQFPRLKILTLWNSNLVCWRAENIHFPNLEKLSLHYMDDLEEIPSGIGDIATLRSINV
ncbi:ToMV susceptible protein tm-2 [Sesamum angolense]|uniref:ToMV susceptible protein tm-2 n=1 Tax=Sesamum angolense TaxID=2727404 RepID=A0AAE1WJQ3_9LAMI|nr:ToMV susceptible protein tm-2 [Sesamum angolense]